MTEYHSVKVNLSDFELDKLKFATKYTTGKTLRLSSDMIDTNENNFLHNLLLVNRQVTSFGKAFFLQIIYKRIHNYEIILGPLIKIGLLLMKNVLQPLAKGVLVPLRLTVVASAADVGIHKKS